MAKGYFVLGGRWNGWCLSLAVCMSSFLNLAM